MEELLEKIHKGDPVALAKAITLLESSRAEDRKTAGKLLNSLPKKTLSTYRLGFTGPPGVGKSTLIENIGLRLTAREQKVAVLAVDPSSLQTGGSILADKTRMEKLSRSSKAFIRPSPSRGHLGGVTSSLPGIILLCELAGFQWILVESVGVGQSEVELSRMVDLLTLVAPPGGGDELQGIKRGILETVDCLLVNKADRDPALSRLSQGQYLSCLRLKKGKEDIMVESCSALTGEGLDRIFDYYFEVFKNPDQTRMNFFLEKRKLFFVHWFESLVHSEFEKELKSDSSWGRLFKQYKKELYETKKSPLSVVSEFFKDMGSQK